MNFKLVSPFKPTGDQPEAIKKLTEGLNLALKHQVLLGVTGSGKTFTMANIIARVQKPTLVISHNKTLAAQLYQEFRCFFPNNAVCYFVSYYDYYQPEAYIPQSDTYIEKETDINEEIDKLRLAATANLLTRKDTIIVASVSCIYNIGSPKEYGNFALEIKPGVRLSRESIIKRLVDLQYDKNNYDFKRGTFRIRGDVIDIFPAYSDEAIRCVLENELIKELQLLDPFNGKTIAPLSGTIIYPAKHYMTNPQNYKNVFAQIKQDLDLRVGNLKKENKIIEAERLIKRVNYDLEMIGEIGYVNGIENYSSYFDGRNPGDPPYTLLDYFEEAVNSRPGLERDWLLFIDESHMSIPQLRGMYNGDRSRKQTLIDFGFRLPAALDNRPLTFTEFSRRMPATIYVSATPNDWEMSLARESAAKVILSDPPAGGESKDLSRDDNNGITEQLVRPTGIVDPSIIIRPSENQINDLAKEILSRKKKNQRVLVTTLTKRTAEALASYLNEKKYLMVHYLHSDIETLVRTDILDDLRSGKYDVVIGINLLREGLDLPEVSLVAILDADKEGFLRSETALIQTMGRAARHIEGTVIMYADHITKSMQKACQEIARRKKIQLAYNKKYHIRPQNIVKPIREKLIGKEEIAEFTFFSYLDSKKRIEYKKLLTVDTNQLTAEDKFRFIKKLEIEMRNAAGQLNFELAAEIRDRIRRLTNLSD